MPGYGAQPASAPTTQFVGQPYYGATQQPTVMQPAMGQPATTQAASMQPAGQMTVGADGTPITPGTFGVQGAFGTTPPVNTRLTENMLGLPQGAAQALMGMPMAPEKPKGLFSFLLSGALKTGAIGAAAGGVAGLVLPFLSMPLGAIIGGVGGAILGAVQGVGKHKAAQENYKIAMQALNPSELGPQAGVDPYTPAPGDPAAGTAAGAAATAAATAAAAAPTKPKARGKRTYVVKTGDTASAIAKRNNISLSSLVAANKMTVSSASRIHPGQKLVIPRRSEG